MVDGCTPGAPPDEPLVPVIELTARSVALQLQELRSAWERTWAPTSPECGFSLWATQRAGLTAPVALGDEKPWSALGVQRWHEAPILAASGYALDAGDTDLAGNWLAGGSRLKQRPALPPDRQSFFFRPLELLGVALGAQAVRERDPSIAAWIDCVVDAGEDLLGEDLLPRVIMALVRLEGGRKPNWHPVAEPANCADRALLLWASAAFPAVQWLARPLPEVEAELLREAMLEPTQVGDAARAALAWISLRIAGAHLIDLTIGSGGAGETTKRLVMLLRRFPLLVRELQQRHGDRTPLAINDEYDVQDLLRGVLTLHFDEVLPEEWTPSYGGTQARVDFLLRAERTVVEVKMTRKGLGQRDVVEQLVIDRDYYRTHPACDRLVCLVYDPGGRIRQPVIVERDLSVETPLPTMVVVTPQGT